MLMLRCNNPECHNVGNDMLIRLTDIEVFGEKFPDCITCGGPLSRVEPLKKFEDDPDPDAKDKIRIGPITEASWPGDLKPGAFNEVNEWMRCRDGIDKAEIALKGFCDEIGAEVTKSRITELCRTLQDMIHTHYELGD
jgi:hypothetical protein